MSSDYHIIPIIINFLKYNDIKNIADVGAGYGIYGVLIRSYLERNPHLSTDWEIHLDAYEIYKRYLFNTGHFYDNMFIEDIKDVSIKDYELVLFIGIIEHFDKEVALNLLDQLIKNNKGVLVYTTLGFEGTGPRENTHQEHKSGFSEEDFINKGLKTQIIFDNRIIAYSQHLKFQPKLRKKIPKKMRRFLLWMTNREKYYLLYDRRML